MGCCDKHGEYWCGVDGPTSCPSCEIHARDADWIARELGDVPVRATWLDELAQRDPGVALAMVLMGSTGQEPRDDGVTLRD